MSTFVLFLVLLGHADAGAVEIAKCFKEVGAVGALPAALKKKPLPPVTSCTDSDPNLCAALLTALEAAEHGKNVNPAQHYLVAKECYNVTIIPLIKNKCLRSCALCCKAPEFDCEDENGFDCGQFLAKKHLCTHSLSNKIARNKCAKTCGLCNKRFDCPDKSNECAFYKQFNLCGDANVKKVCEGTCGLDTCLVTPAIPAPTPVGCTDNASDCKMFGQLGYCWKSDSVAKRIKARCPKTCQLCA